MSQLLSGKYNTTRKHGVHKDRIYNSHKDVKKNVRKINDALKKVRNKPYFIHRRLSESKMMETLNFEVKEYMEDLMYISQHFRYTDSVKRSAKKAILEVENKIESMAKNGMEF